MSDEEKIGKPLKLRRLPDGRIEVVNCQDFGSMSNSDLEELWKKDADDPQDFISDLYR